MNTFKPKWSVLRILETVLIVLISVFILLSFVGMAAFSFVNKIGLVG